MSGLVGVVKAKSGIVASPDFPGPASGSFGGHVIQSQIGIYQCTGDLTIGENSDAYGPVVSMKMKTTNAKILAIINHAETYANLSTHTMSVRLAYKTSSYTAGQGNTSHGATVISDIFMKIRQNASSSMTANVAGTLSNSAGQTIYFSPEAIVSSGSAYPNYGGVYGNITLTVFEMQS